MEEASFFVTDIPDGARKFEIWKLYEKFGNLFDVFMGKKKRWNGQNYAFIRFKEVSDVNGLEKQLDGQRFRGKVLAVNVSTQKRKQVLRDKPEHRQANQPTNRTRPVPTNNWRDHRSYADATKPAHNRGAPPKPVPPPPPPILIRQEKDTLGQLQKSTLIGEAKTLSHLGHLPNLLFINEETSIEIKYLGGMKVLILFGSSMEAEAFRKNESRWKDNLKWVRHGDDRDLTFDRVAWIRIVGLPVRFWGDKNFEAISNRFGKTIAPFDKVFNRVDLSVVKIGIITSRKTRINEEITVATPDEIFNVGVVEFDEDWFPFRFDPSEDIYEPVRPISETDADGVVGSDNDGISETWLEGFRDDMEEGEIPENGNADSIPTPDVLPEEPMTAGVNQNADQLPDSPEVEGQKSGDVLLYPGP